MTMVQVRPVGVAVRDSLMFVPVRMPVAGREAGMDVRMMLVIVPVHMLMDERFVFMLMCMLVSE